MKRLTYGIAACALAAAIGCNQGTSTAPGTGRTNSTNRSADDTARKLTVSVRGNQVITQDLTDEITVMIDRDNFSAPVDIRFDNLPKGVSVVTREMTIPADKESMTVTLKAAPDFERQMTRYVASIDEKLDSLDVAQQQATQLRDRLDPSAKRRTS